MKYTLFNGPLNQHITVSLLSFLLILRFWHGLSLKQEYARLDLLVQRLGLLQNQEHRLSHKAHLYRSAQTLYCLGRVLIKDIPCEQFVFCHIPLLRHGAKGMKLDSEARAFKMRMLENEILNLVGERREKAMKVYRKLFSCTSNQLVYLMRI
jgi:hypothetical protein